jgi:hypothetical protein
MVRAEAATTDGAAMRPSTVIMLTATMIVAMVDLMAAKRMVDLTVATRLMEEAHPTEEARPTVVAHPMAAVLRTAEAHPTEEAHRTEAVDTPIISNL